MGSFDETFARAKYEDQDMFWRLRRARLHVTVTLDVVIHYHGSQTVREEPTRTPGFEAVNKRYFDRTWRSQWHRRKRRKLRLEARHLLWRLRGGPRY